MQLIDFIETDRNLKVATTNYDTVSQGGGKFFRELDAPQLPPGQAPPQRGFCPGGRPSGPAAAAGFFI